jgi:hypothetical protein
VFSITTTYSSELTTDHPTWTSKFSEGPVFYYEAIQLTVLINDPVTFTSDVNVCGFLYEGQFDPTAYSTNLIELNHTCDEDTDKPFNFTALVKNKNFRILVVTSRRRYETKSFTITMRSAFSKVLIERFIVITRTTTTTIAATTTAITTNNIITTTTACRYSHIID